MWLTTSKNANNALKKLARQIADALPNYKFVPRGVKPLERMDRLAQRAGQACYLVLGKSNIDGKPMLLSRHYVEDGDTCVWMWRGKRMEGLEAEAGKLEEPDEPYEFVFEGKEAEEMAEFFGYAKGKEDAAYEESVKVEIKAKKTSGAISVGGRAAASFKFSWKNIDGSEE